MPPAPSLGRLRSRWSGLLSPCRRHPLAALGGASGIIFLALLHYLIAPRCYQSEATVWIHRPRNWLEWNNAAENNPAILDSVGIVDLGPFLRDARDPDLQARAIAAALANNQSADRFPPTRTIGTDLFAPLDVKLEVVPYRLGNIVAFRVQGPHRTLNPLLANALARELGHAIELRHHEAMVAAFDSTHSRPWPPEGTTISFPLRPTHSLHVTPVPGPDDASWPSLKLNLLVAVFLAPCAAWAASASARFLSHRGEG